MMKCMVCGKDMPDTLNDCPHCRPMKTKYETVEFYQDSDDLGCSIEIYYCHIEGMGDRIGIVERGRRRYYFSPDCSGDCCYTEQMLLDIGAFLKQLNEQARKERGE